MLLIADSPKLSRIFKGLLSLQISAAYRNFGFYDSLRNLHTNISLYFKPYAIYRLFCMM